MRILIGTGEIAGMMPILADGFRQLGHEVTTVIRHRNPLYPHITYDYDLTVDMMGWPVWFDRPKALPIRIPRYLMTQTVRWSKLLTLIATHDVFFFQYLSLLPDNRDYPLLRRLGKRIVSFFVGDDVRHASAYDQEYGSRIHETSTLKKIEDYCGGFPLLGPLHRLRMAELYSSLILSIPSQSGLALRPYMRSWVPIDISKYECFVPGRDVPVVVHAPSSKAWKGTEQILRALERLRSEGVPFELRLLHGVPHEEVLDELAGADVAVDQLHLFLHGKFAVEAMASGCAVATANREDLEPMPPNRPILHIDPANVYEQLWRLLTDKELRLRLAHEGRRYVERYNDHVRVARYFIENLSGDPAKQYHFYPTFFARHYRLPEGEVVPHYLRKMTAKVIERWGLPEDVDPQGMIERGLMADGVIGSNGIARWETGSARESLTIREGEPF